ncbi:MAG: tetratricopeptide repeat protein [Flavobacterium sp.]|jgi:tetratricopeptide (TPR) repeat protein|uniref:tetratricopeptide repeat protein n=2 Tax=Flavobacterium sp. TaxID=239 RepID=UPI001B4F0B92|nr:tetratricopeptide repeat protein [Flavobacterium sp.]MBP6146850.1 tetratricopeptide repeat protein [Flavobacterium sp.]MBP7182674.1 tetratricopeptide repeat protein [Flavobacterium sp.]MBP7318695.1 tetratricopeptide repeat protein [Flavobacterium sp.]MBP8887683.1 tetratricopeptide repeat protein [Flavobacterium sp.]HRL72222.1 tetratricopeptide repeat protein [Flavobacterium sp.]
MQLSNEEEDYNLSLSKFESMLKTNKVLFFDSEEFEEIILHYLDMGKAALAKKALKLALEQHPKSTGLKLVQVEMLVYDDKLELAEKLLNELYAIEPTNEEIYIQKANICSKRDQHEKAVELLKTALKYTDDYADVYNLIGMEYLFMDNLEKAKENFIKCLEEDLEDQSALYNVVYCFEFLDQNQEAIAYLNKYIDKNPYSEIAWHQLGRLHYGVKEYENAIRAFEYATLIDDEFLGAFMEKAKAYERLKKYEEAIESYSRTIELDDATSYALLRMGKCYEKLGNKALALKHFNQTVHEDPLLDKGWIAITDFYVRQKNYQKALFFVNKALAIDNQNHLYWKRYASINKQMNFFEEAEFGYRKAVEFGETGLETWLFWVDILQFLGEFESAIQTLLQASEYFPEENEVEYRLAGLYFMLTQNTKAKFHLSNALRLNFDNHIILEDLFPAVWTKKMVQNYIAKHKKQ